MADVKFFGNDGLAWDHTQSPSYFQLERFQAALSGTLKSIRVYVTGSENVKVALYSDNAGSPNALLASSGSTAVVSGWNTISISDVSIVSGTYYWIGHNTDNYYLQAYGSGGKALYKSATYSSFTFPNPAGSGFTSDTWRFAHVAYGVEGGAGPVIPVFMNQYRRRVA